MAIERNFLAELFFHFESEKFNQIRDLNLRNFNAWQIIKFPLYFDLIQHKHADQSFFPQKNKALRLFHKIAGSLRLILSLLKLFFKVRFRKNIVLFYTFSADKPSKDKDGNYFNFLTDIFVTKRIVSSYIYAEKSLNGDYKRPSPVQPDFYSDDLSNLISVYLRLYAKDKEFAQIAEKLYGNLTNYFIEKKAEIDISRKLIQEMLICFYASYKAAKFFLKSCNPALLISSEQPGMGLLAAARDLNIISMDLQHGIIDKFHPQYIYSGALRDVKEKMILPTYIGVFGQLHKNILLSSGFWNEDEIVILGSSKVDINRRKYSSGNGEMKSIIIPTQWTFFEEMKGLLKMLLESPSTGLKIILKIHPLEPQYNIDYYYTLNSRYPGKLEIADKNNDIYRLIAKAFLVIGFNSAVLLESVSLLKPCITITTKDSPEGIHSFFKDEQLKNAIKSVPINDKDRLQEIVDKAMHDESFYKEWILAVQKEADYLYAMNYIDNCSAFIEHIFSKN